MLLSKYLINIPWYLESRWFLFILLDKGIAGEHDGTELMQNTQHTRLYMLSWCIDWASNYMLVVEEWNVFPFLSFEGIFGFLLLVATLHLFFLWLVKFEDDLFVVPPMQKIDKWQHLRIWLQTSITILDLPFHFVDYVGKLFKLLLIQDGCNI